MKIEFTVYGTPQPQGSSRAFMPKGWKRPIITSANPKLKPWRQQISGTAIAEASKVDFPMLERTVPVRACLKFYFARPAHLPKKIVHKMTRPDVEKCARSVLDALTGSLYTDDSQVVECNAKKDFGDPERVEIMVETLCAPKIESSSLLSGISSMSLK